MKTIKRLMLLLLILVLSLAAAALAETLPAAWEDRVLKLTLENGYRLNVEDRNEYISEMYYANGDAESMLPEGGIPVYTVHVPSDADYVYMYTHMDDDAGHYSFSINDTHYAGMVEVNGEGVAYVKSGQNVVAAFQPMDKNEINLQASTSTMVVSKLPVVSDAGNSGTQMLVFEEMDDSYNYTFPFALYFEQSSVNTSSIPTEEILVSGLASWDATVQGKETIKLTANVHPIGATDADSITWTSSDDSIISIGAAIAGSGSDYEWGFVEKSVATLVPHKAGKVTITASCGDVTATYPVNLRAVPVTEPVVDAVALDKTAADIWYFAAGQQFPSTGYDAYRDQFPASLSLTATAKAGEDIVEDAAITWSSSNESVATVENGIVTAAGAGEAVITASCGDITASCAVTVSSFVAPGYTNVSVGSDWVDPSLPSGLKNSPKVLDLSSDAQPRTFTVVGSACKNVGEDNVKTLSSIQAMTWIVTDKNNCVTYTDNGNGTLTVTATGKKGVVTFMPVLLNGEYNVRLCIYFSDGFVSNASIVRTDGKPWSFSETITINKKTHNVFNMVQGDAVSIRIDTPDNDISHSYDGWHWEKLNSSYASIQTKGVNGETYDLSTLKPGLYELRGRTPLYEQDYIIDPLGMNKQDFFTTDVLYIRVNEKPAVIPGDLTGEGDVDSDDAVILLQYAAGKKQLTSEQIKAADFSGDGELDTDDAVLILQMLAGKSN